MNIPTSSHLAAQPPQPAGPEDREAAIPSLGWPASAVHSVADAVLHTVAYADIFDYPLTTHEIHYYLTAYSAPLATVEDALASAPQLRDRLDARPPYWFLRGSEHTVALRQQREAFSQSLWPLARRYGRFLAAFPFVRLVAISGSLTKNNVSDPQDDIDFLLVARPGRVWFVRGEALVFARLTRRLGTELCPNFILSEHRLALDGNDYFTAHELAQLLPLHGNTVYQRLMEANAWGSGYLPNAWANSRTGQQIGRADRSFQRIAEWTLGGRIGDAMERWERDRKIERLRHEALALGSPDAEFGPDMCKGHKRGHGARARRLFAERMESLVGR